MISVHTEFKQGQHHGQTLLLARNDPRKPADSQQHFLKEHSWGFGRARSGKRFRYQVSHPV